MHASAPRRLSQRMRDAALLARPVYRYVAGDGGNNWRPLPSC